jgi:large subunit ribosomal protein L10
MIRTEKEAAVANIRETFASMSSAVFVDYGGLSVEQVDNLRGKFRERGVTYKVFKNTLIRKALSDAAYIDKLAATALKGMTGVALSFEEPSAAARVVKEFAKENEKLTIKAGLMDGAVLDAKAVENQLATLPSKDEARAMLLAQLNAPAQSFVRLLNAPAQNFTYLLEAKRTKDGG